MTDEEMITRMRRTAYASIYGGWGVGEFAWLLEVAERMESLINEQDAPSHT